MYPHTHTYIDTHKQHNTFKLVCFLHMHAHTRMHTHTRTHTHARPTQVSTSPSFSAATVNVKNKIYMWLMKIQVHLLSFTVPVTNYCIKYLFYWISYSIKKYFILIQLKFICLVGIPFHFLQVDSLWKNSHS